MRQKKAVNSRLAELEREFIKSGGKWEEYTIERLFSIQTPKKKFNANKLTFNGNYPYVARG
ncbi:TPA: hypothetical protein ACHY0L_005186, partial [Escherichia coli]